MICIELRFPAGRYHATPWGHAVNEGAVEWPPSPWRLLRALAAMWHAHSPSVQGADFDRLVAALGSDAPRFHLPPAGSGHTRHYMPLGSRSAGKTKLVLQAFVCVLPDCPVTVVWPETTLTGPDRELLATLLAALPYMGRAESTVEASLVEDLDIEPNCSPKAAAPTGSTEEATDEVEVLVPGPGVCLASLDVDTATIRRGSRPLPPDARMATYRREAGALEPRRTPRTKVVVDSKWPTTARFTLHGAVLPSVRDTVVVAERMRAAAMSCFTRVFEKPAPEVLSGKADGRPAVGHRHCYWVPLDNDGDGKLDTVFVVARSGIDPETRRALQDIEYLHVGARASLRLRVGLSGFQGAIGQDETANLDEVAFQGTGPESARTAGPGARWVFATPWIPGRHPKRSDRREDGARSFFEKTLTDELALHDVVASSVELTSWCQVGARRMSTTEFRTARTSKARMRSFGAQVELTAEHGGPILLGAGAHFGLGRLVCVA